MADTTALPEPTPIAEPVEDRVEAAEKGERKPRRRPGGAEPTMTLTVKVKRFNPETDERPRWDTFQVPAEAMDRALDLLHYVKWHLDGSLTFRKSCAHGICGSDAMKINGENQLACSILVQDLGLKDGDTVTFEPLPAAPVIKDLVIDQARFFDKYRAVMPWLINDGATPEKERIQSPEQHAVIEDATKCIMCGACTHSCPSTWADPDYLGPGRHAQGVPLRVRQPRHRARGAAQDRRLEGRPVEVLHDLQLRPGVPEGDRHHALALGPQAEGRHDAILGDGGQGVTCEEPERLVHPSPRWRGSQVSIILAERRTLTPAPRAVGTGAGGLGGLR